MSTKHTHRGRGAVRIISGDWRGSKLPVPDVPGLRPTSDRARETVFNWLNPWLPGARCVDLFAGTGVLGFEAVSRGAASCVLVESHSKAVDDLRASASRLRADAVTVVQTTVESYLLSCTNPFDLVFADPPFDVYSAATLSTLLVTQVDPVVRAGGWVYVEHARDQSLENLPAHWRLHRSKSLGEVTINLFQVGE